MEEQVIQKLGKEHSKSTLTSESLEIYRNQLNTCWDCGSSSIKKDGDRSRKLSFCRDRKAYETTQSKMLNVISLNRKGTCKPSTVLSTCSCSPVDGTQKSVSKVFSYSEHKRSRDDPYGSHWNPPCSSNRDSILCKQRKGEQHALTRNVGKKFQLTEKPLVDCFKQNLKKKRTRSKDHYQEIVGKIYTADNVNDLKKTKKVEYIELDVDNPLGLDYQGEDWKETYTKDEQTIEYNREYIIQKRYCNQKVLQKEAEQQINERQLLNKIVIPDFFSPYQVYNSKDCIFEELKETEELEKEEDVCEVKSSSLVALYRVPNKEINKTLTEMEKQRRFGRQNDMFLTLQEKRTENLKQQEKINNENEENFVLDLINQDLKEILEEPKNEIKIKLKEPAPEIIEKINYPTNLMEVENLRNKMKKTNKILRDKAILKNEFYKELGINKNRTEANLEISDDSQGSSTSRMSIKDEDNLSVGVKSDQRFFVRGFHYKFGVDLRGKKNPQLPKRTMTRTDQIHGLVRRGNERFFSYTSQAIDKHNKPGDPRMNLFNLEKRQIPMWNKSAIADHIKESKPECKKKGLQIRKPKNITVKTFNLTKYLYNNSKKEDSTKSIRINDEKPQSPVLDGKKVKEQSLKLFKRQQRLKYLNISFEKEEESENSSISQSNSVSSDPDWVPSIEDKITAKKINIDTLSSQTFYRTLHTRLFTGPVLDSQNVPAPLYREPTLRRHPRKPRIKSAVIDTLPTAKKEMDADVPCMLAMPEDKVIYTNLDMKDAPYVKMFNARHHHDYLDPVQFKLVNVRYNPKLPKLRIEELEQDCKIEEPKKFLRGRRTDEFIDRSLPRINIEELLKVKSFKKHSGFKQVDFEKNDQIENRLMGGEETKDDDADTEDSTSEIKDNTETTDNFQKNTAFDELFKDLAIKLRREVTNVKDKQTENTVDKDKYFQELEEEVKSIKSCSSSMQGSYCTNFTHDSGSFMMLENKKLPLDYIRKSLVPFEEIDRTRLRFIERSPEKEYYRPKSLVPVAAEKIVQKSLLRPDKFFTCTTRLQDNIRKRLQIQSNRSREWLNVEPKKDAIQDYYNESLKDAVVVKTFKRQTAMQLSKNILRNNFTIWQTKQIKSVKNIHVEYINDIQNLQKQYIELLTLWKKFEYDETMEIVQLDKLYERTINLKNTSEELEQMLARIKMQIVFAEDSWIRRKILQKFNYLLMDNNWRDENDWMHRNEDGSLQNYRDAIATRRTDSIRNREHDNPEAIQKFYKDYYEKYQYPYIIVFPDAESFTKGVNFLKIRTFVCLLELHFAMWIDLYLNKEYRTIITLNQNIIDVKQRYVDLKSTQTSFWEERGSQLKTTVTGLIDEPLTNALASPRLKHIRAYSNVLFNRFMPENIKSNVKQNMPTIQKVKQFFEFVQDLLAKLDRFPVKQRQKIEHDYRIRLKYEKELSKRAYQMERRIQNTVQEIKRNMMPPYKKLPRIGKLKRTYLKKKVIIEEEPEPVISERAKILHKAFFPDDQPLNLQELNVPDFDFNYTEDSCTQFDFDQFLIANGYKPNYDFKTMVEIRDGPQEASFKYQELLPEVMEKLKRLEENKKKKNRDRSGQQPC